MVYIAARLYLQSVCEKCLKLPQLSTDDGHSFYEKFGFAPLDKLDLLI